MQAEAEYRPMLQKRQRVWAVRGNPQTLAPVTRCGWRWHEQGRGMKEAEREHAPAGNLRGRVSGGLEAPDTLATRHGDGWRCTRQGRA